MRESLRSPPPAARSDSKPMVEPSGDTRPSWSIAGLLVRSVDTPLRYRYSSKFPDLLDPARMVGLEHAVTVTAIGWAADPLVKVTVAVPAAFPRKKNWVESRVSWVTVTTVVFPDTAVTGLGSRFQIGRASCR